MKNGTLTTLKYYITAVIITFAFSISNAQETPVDAEGNKIMGTWNIVGTIVSCADGSPLPVQLRGLNSFSQGGVMMEIPSGLPPASRTPGLGVWQHVGGRNYVGTFKAFMFDNGTPAGKSIFIANIRHELDDTLTSRGVLTNYNAAGVIVQTICISGVGTRFTGED